MEKRRLGRIRNRIDSGFPENPSREAGTVQIQQGSDPERVLLRSGTVADDDQLILQRRVNHSCVSAGPCGFGEIRGGYRIGRRILQERPINHIPVPGRPGNVLRLRVGFMNQGSRLPGVFIQDNRINN